MALYVEPEKKQANVFQILMALVVAAAIFAGAYFLLFKRPELLDVVVQNRPLVDLSKIQFEPERVLQDEKIKALRQYDGVLPTPATGKSNPFLP